MTEGPKETILRVRELEVRYKSQRQRLPFEGSLDETSSVATLAEDFTTARATTWAPSPEDRLLAERIGQAGRMFGAEVRDAVIVSNAPHDVLVSFRDNRVF